MGAVVDLTGKRFGWLTANRRIGTDNNGQALWECACDCGQIAHVTGGNLKRGNTTKCNRHKVKDITGQKFGRLTALEISGWSNGGEAMWLCKCECGTEKVVNGTNLRRGHVVSCGCVSPLQTHGMRHTKMYKTFHDIHCRCNRADNHVYGGKGITVCDEWSSFEPFMKWSLENGYKDDLSLDRIDPDGNYCPENCRWTDMITQARNKGLLPANTTGYSGVNPHNGKYAASIRVDGKRQHLGTFDTIQEAATARRDAELKYWGWTKIEMEGIA